MSTITSRPSAAATAPSTLPVYPAHYACDVVLRNGSTLHLRPIRTEDRAALQAFHQHLSPESLHLRFMSFAGATPAVAARLLAAAGIPMLRARAVSTIDHAVDAAREIGLPAG